MTAKEPRPMLPGWEMGQGEGWVSTKEMGDDYLAVVSWAGGWSWGIGLARGEETVVVVPPQCSTSEAVAQRMADCFFAETKKPGQPLPERQTSALLEGGWKTGQGDPLVSTKVITSSVNLCDQEDDIPETGIQTYTAVVSWAGRWFWSVSCGGGWLVPPQDAESETDARVSADKFLASAFEPPAGVTSSSAPPVTQVSSVASHFAREALKQDGGNLSLDGFANFARLASKDPKDAAVCLQDSRLALAKVLDRYAMVLSEKLQERPMRKGWIIETDEETPRSHARLAPFKNPSSKGIIELTARRVLFMDMRGGIDMGNGTTLEASHEILMPWKWDVFSKELERQASGWAESESDAQLKAELFVARLVDEIGTWIKISQ